VWREDREALKLLPSLHTLPRSIDDAEGHDLRKLATGHEALDL
jgi:hypothetical protein